MSLLVGWNAACRTLPRLHRMPLTYATVAPARRLAAPAGARRASPGPSTSTGPARRRSPGRRSRTPTPSSGCGSRAGSPPRPWPPPPPPSPPGSPPTRSTAVGHEFLLDHGAYPSTLGYKGFPKSLCTSVNEVVCHGIPDSRRLEDGDIVNIDITAFIDGVHGDTDATYLVGDVDEESRLLVERTHEAMMRGIRAAVPGREVNVIGRVIQSYARRFGYGVVRDFTGHGIGSSVPQRPGHPPLRRRPVLQHRHRGRHDVHRRADAQPRHRTSGRCGTTAGPCVTKDRRRSAQSRARTDPHLVTGLTVPRSSPRALDERQA